MALIVEDGTARSDAESYASVAEADAYHAAYGAPAAWTAATTAAKETALRAATQYLDATYRLRWQGHRTRQEQALCWPRYGARDADRYLMACNLVPPKLKEAAAVLALAALTEDLMPDAAAGASGIVAESKTVGPISTSKTYGGIGKASVKQYRKAYLLVAEFLGSGNYVERG